jgi:putative PIN family toxin of toxin-antitoxin system
MKLVLDTNIFISGLLFPKSSAGKLVKLCLNEKFELCLSESMIQEIERVLFYPKIRKCFKLSDAEIENYCSLLKFNSHFFDTKSIKAKVPKDKNDDHILATFLASGAQYLITGDDDLLSLKQTYRIISLRDFARDFVK